MSTALATLLDYLGRQWLPVDVKDAYDSVARAQVMRRDVAIDDLEIVAALRAELERLEAENERLKARCHPREAFL